jgi:tRNA(Ile)-lysidine synthase
VLAVSGGTDSTALALIVAELADEFGLVLHVAHFDHRARPRAAAADVQFVSEIADRIGAPIRVGRAERAPKSEDDARRERYVFLRRAAEQIGATAIATGHTLDDQAETVLLHLTRGSGIAGASAMRPLRGGIVRPLLVIGRAETAAICRAAGIAPREDPTNTSLRFARNRVRAKILPELARINPQVREALARFADAAAEAGAAADGGAVADARAAAETGPSDARPDTHGHAAARTRAATGADIEFDLRALPSGAAERGAALAAGWRRAVGPTLGSRHRDALLRLSASSAGTRSIDLPGGIAVREYERLRFEPPRGRTAPASGREAHPKGAANARTGATTDAQSRAANVLPNDVRKGDTRSTPLPRGASVEWHGWRISLGMERDGLLFAGAVDAASADRLVIRSRRPGDRVSERGKLQDVFVDAKVPLRLRDTWPLVTLDDQVIWAPGLTPEPHGGRIPLSAGPVGDAPTAGEDVPGRTSRVRQVASKSEARRQGGKRGRP